MHMIFLTLFLAIKLSLLILYELLVSLIYNHCRWLSTLASDICLPLAVRPQVHIIIIIHSFLYRHKVVTAVAEQVRSCQSLSYHCIMPGEIGEILA